MASPVCGQPSYWNGSHYEKDHIHDSEYSPASHEQLYPTIHFTAVSIPEEDFELGLEKDVILIGYIEIRTLHGDRLQVVLSAFYPVIDHVFEQIDKEIIRIWPIAAAPDVSRKLLDQVPAPSKEILRAPLRNLNWRKSPRGEEECCSHLLIITSVKEGILVTH